MNRKKIMFLHSGAELYGADQILLTIVSNIDKTKFEPIVVLPNDGPLVQKLIQNNIRYKIISYPIIRRKYFNVKGILKFIKEYKKACKKLCDFAKKEKIDIIHNNTVAVIEGISIKRKLNIPLIFHVHEMIEHPKIVAKKLYKLAVNNSDKVVVVSSSVKKYIMSLIGNKFNNIEVIHNGIKPVKCFESRNKYLKEFGIPNDSKVVAVIGRINAVKGQEHFIDSLKTIIDKDDKTYGLIIGDAFEGQEWRVDNLISKLKNDNMDKRIIYCGFRNDVHNLFSIIDVLVLSSVGYDSFPTVVLEAMSCKKPVVAYDCGGVSEMIENGKNGYLVQHRNIDELSQKIDLVLNGNIKNYGEKSFEIFTEKFSLEKFIERFSSLYMKL